MGKQKIQEYDANGKLIHEEEVELSDPPTPTIDTQSLAQQVQSLSETVDFLILESLEP